MSASEYVYGEDDRLIAWAESRVANSRFRDDARAIGHERAGELRGVVVFDTFTTTTCLVHLASDGSKRWMTREFITRVFAYPFIQCKFPRITCGIPETNAESLRLTRHMGWVEEGRLREDSEDGSDTIIFGMLRRECRWLPATIGGTGKIVRATV
ncbi:hypothetical protein [Allomesorhizobium alhagi]|uniref:Gp68 n=1 Tax=Mesorhizobium alhagi CCNWXJ12-2 TaxID=1107882 RepID=H0HNH1_9HYPH|nr:hypothetical protein [Mesorhizobium alhagi]EHK57743.1 gp68 [Mesorhizobium alhagi CCNWXJ12-2]